MDINEILLYLKKYSIDEYEYITYYKIDSFETINKYSNSEKMMIQFKLLHNKNIKLFLIDIDVKKFYIFNRTLKIKKSFLK